MSELIVPMVFSGVVTIVSLWMIVSEINYWNKN
jgi:hypothetical protein